jgi:hypothetical protein
MRGSWSRTMIFWRLREEDRGLKSCQNLVAMVGDWVSTIPMTDYLRHPTNLSCRSHIG